MTALGSLEGKAVLVTGGGAGIGRAICVACAGAGASVVVASPGRNGEETAALATEAGGTAWWQETDVTVSGDVADAVAAARTRYGGLDAVVHNATSRRSSRVGALADLEDDAWEDHVAVSLRGAFHCARAARADLAARRGRMIVMTSPAGIEGSAARPAYAAVKGALRGFVKSLALEWGPEGIGVVAVSPLAMTPAMAAAYRADPTLQSRLEGLVPLGRIGNADLDIAPVVTFLIGDGARYLTGQTIVVDGGRFTTL